MIRRLWKDKCGCCVNISTTDGLMKMQLVLLLLFSLLIFMPSDIECASVHDWIYDHSGSGFEGQKIQVFILAGQSNMVGKGYIPMLRELCENNVTKSYYEPWVLTEDEKQAMTHSWNHDIYESDYFRTLGNVKIHWMQRNGYLTVGYGFPNDRIGPELEFGRVIAEYFKNYPPWSSDEDEETIELEVPEEENASGRASSFVSQSVEVEEKQFFHSHSTKEKKHPFKTEKKVPILIIKVAYGGKSLQTNFLPPSMVIPNYTDLVKHDDGGKVMGNLTLEEVKQSMYSHRDGKWYRKLIDTIRDELDRVSQGKRFGLKEFEMRGFVWWQGWSDLKDPSNYETQIKAFFSDIQTDLGFKDPMPIIIGETGQLGMHPRRPNSGTPQLEMMQLRRAQRKVAQENHGFMRYVPTGRFFYNREQPDENGFLVSGRLADAEDNRFYHYNGRPDTYVQVGRAFGEAMVELMEDMRHADIESTN